MIFLRMIQEFHQNGRLMMGLNPTFIVLVPKKKYMMNLSDFRPISLDGKVYKII